MREAERREQAAIEYAKKAQEENKNLQNYYQTLHVKEYHLTKLV
jgi:hypothetical protein